LGFLVLAGFLSPFPGGAHQRAFLIVGAVVLSGGVRLVGGIGTLAQGAVLLGVAPAGSDQGAFFSRRAWRCRCQGFLLGVSLGILYAF
jgi:hypothetical protein